MIHADLMPQAEALRLAAVRRYDILDTPPDGMFDRVTELAAQLFSVPISIVSIVDEDRIWFKSHHGLDVPQIDRGPGLCASAILHEEPWVLTDASTDLRSLANPLVAGEFGLRFYVGVPLRTHDGHNLGTLCVIDREPRSVTDAQIGQLRLLAQLVVDQLELRLASLQAIGQLSAAVADKDAALARAAMMAKEIDHRVMNSLQLISALLGMQARGLGGSEAAEQLSLAANRVAAIAQVHRHIYQSETSATVECARFLESLCGDLSTGLGLEQGRCIRVEAAAAEVPVEQIVPLGLIAAELVTNAAKCGARTIRVCFEAEEEECRLVVADDGRGLPEGFDPAAAGGLGMKVVSSLARQLGGALEWGSSDEGGARMLVGFPRTD